METYLTIEELANYLKVAEQTIRRWVLNRDIPFCKIKKVIRFRLTEIEKWVDNSGVLSAAVGENNASGGLFDGTDGGDAQKCARTGEGVDEINLTRRAPQEKHHGEKCNRGQA